MALLWNPTTGRVITQYHVVFKDDFSTVPYMKACTLPPNWEDLVKLSPEIATTRDVSLADTWLNGKSVEVAMDKLLDPFAIVTDHTKRPRTNYPGSPSPNKSIHTSNSKGDDSHGITSLSSQHEQVNQAAENSFASVGSSSSNKAVDRSHTDIFGSNPMFASKTHDSELEAFANTGKVESL